MTTTAGPDGHLTVIVAAAMMTGMLVAGTPLLVSHVLRAETAPATLQTVALATQGVAVAPADVPGAVAAGVAAGTATPLSGVNSVVAMVGVGSEPDAVAYDPVSGDIYVADILNNAVWIFSAATITEVANLAVGTTPDALAYDSGTGDVLVANEGDGTVSVISGATNSVVGTIPVGSAPTGLAYDPQNGNVYVADDGSSSVTVLNGASTVTTVAVGSSPFAVAYDSQDGLIYVTNSGSHNVSVISGSTNAVVATVPVGSEPIGVAFDSTSDEVFVANLFSGNATVISGASHAVIGSVTCGGYPFGAGYDGGNGEIYVTNEGSNNVTVISGSTLSVVASVPMGSHSEPRAVGYDDANGYVYVANTLANVVSVIAGGFTVQFSESGLPAGTSWSVILGGTLASSTDVTVGFDALSGTFAYQVLPKAGYTASSTSGGVNVDGRFLVSVAFNPVLYAVTVTETGLVAGTVWSATVASEPRSSSGDSIVYNLPNGTYSYSLSSVAGYTLTGGSGTVTVNGSPAPVGASYQPVPSTFVVWVNETGLPQGTSWSAVVGGTEQSTTGTSLTFTRAAGTYQYQVLAVTGYTPSPQSGVITVTDDYVIPVAYALSPAASPATSSVSVTGFAEGLTAAAVIGAVGLGVGLTALIMSRRGRPPT